MLFPDAAPPDEDLIKGLIGHALGDEHDASVQVAILPNPAARTRTDVMVSIFEPVPDDARPPIRVRTVRYERELPHLKHLATLGQTLRRIEARHAGFDDVLFVDREDSLCEGSGWNIAFWDGARVVWPDGPQLAGITMQLLRLGLHRLGVPDVSRRLTSVSLHEMTAAVATNSHCAAQPIAAVDDRVLPGDEDFITLLKRAWREADWAPIR